MFFLKRTVQNHKSKKAAYFRRFEHFQTLFKRR
nr:MAG TPA: hypothetical protein [Caudoviricetes sp.]